MCLATITGSSSPSLLLLFSSRRSFFTLSTCGLVSAAVAVVAWVGACVCLHGNWTAHHHYFLLPASLLVSLFTVPTVLLFPTVEVWNVALAAAFYFFSLPPFCMTCVTPAALSLCSLPACLLLRFTFLAALVYDAVYLTHFVYFSVRSLRCKLLCCCKCRFVTRACRFRSLHDPPLDLFLRPLPFLTALSCWNLELPVCVRVA